MSPPAATDPSDSGMRGTRRLRRQVGLLRALTIVSLVLVVVLAVWSVVGIVSLSSQVSSLEAKVDALSAQLAEQGAPPGAGGSPEAQSTPQSEASGEAVAPAEPLAAGDIDLPEGAGAGGAIVVGDPKATKVVEVYVDYQCPYCQRWETEIGSALMARALQPDSGLAVRQYNMAFLGEKNRSLSPPGASARAASAAACVLDIEGPGAFAEFNAAIFAAPGGADPAARFDAASLVALAKGVGAGPETVSCIEGDGFVAFVAATTQTAFARGVTGTPTVLVDGKPLKDPFGDAELLALLKT